MTNLQLVPTPAKQGRLTVEELLALLGPDHLGAIDRKAKIMRETYQCPYMVADHDGFKNTIFTFYAHYQKAFYNIDLNKMPDREFAKTLAYNFVQQDLGMYQGGLRAAERNAITGRDGGMIAVIDALTEAITKHHTEYYIRSVFFDRIAPGDYDTRYRLADELLKKYGQFLFPGEQLIPAYMFVNNIEELIHSFVTHIHALRREWRD